MSDLDWQACAEQMATGLAVVDTDMRLQWINPALAEWLEWGPRSALGQPLAALLGDASRQAQRSLAQQRPVQLRGVVLTAVSGRQTRVDIALQPLDGGLLLEAHALAESPSGQSPLSATLRGFAHEMKNPLAGLRGAAQLLQRRVPSEDLQALGGLIID
jgi:two-component system nitrogen regulation sensor histidine kinase GlnL